MTSHGQDPATPGSITYVGLLRGINVGKARQVAMPELCAAVESAGYERVRTALRSGNVVFAGPARDTARVAEALERAIASRLSMRVAVIVRTVDELARAVAANPLPDAVRDGSHLHVLFLATPLTADERGAIDPRLSAPDEVHIADREVYVWYRNGMSGSRTAEELGRRVKTTATDRNWNTISRLLSLARDQ